MCFPMQKKLSRASLTYQKKKIPNNQIFVLFSCRLAIWLSTTTNKYEAMSFHLTKRCYKEYRQS